MKDENKFWNKIAENYDAQSNARFAKLYQDTIISARKYLNPSDIALDFACGTGLTTVPLAQYVQKIYAIDTSDAMISIAKKKAQTLGASNIDFSVAEIFEERFKESSFDVIMAFNVLHFFRDPKNVLARILALLKSGGIFLSATDCYRENRSLLTAVQPLVSRLGIIPYMKQYLFTGLKRIISEGKFEILEAKNLYIPPDRLTAPNYFVAARKPATSSNL